MLEGLQGFKLGDGGFVGVQCRRRGLIVTLPRVVVLLRDDLFLGELLPALGGHPGEFKIGLILLERSASRGELLVEFGSFEFRQNLPGFHVISNIHEPFGNVAIGPGENGGFEIRDDGAGQPQLVRFGVRLDVDHIDARFAHLHGKLLLRAFLGDVAPDAGDEDDGQGEDDEQRPPNGDPAFRRASSSGWR